MRHITLRDCIVATADYFEIPEKKLTGNCRQRRYTIPRQVTMHVARNLTSLSYPQIASRLGNRDHSTIRHGEKLIDRLKESDPKVRSAVADVCEKLADDLYRDKMNAAWAIGRMCRALNAAVAKGKRVPVFIERLSLEDIKQVCELPRIKAKPAIKVPAKLPPSMIPPPSKAKLMGARA